MIKLWVNETKWSSLLARTRVPILYISVWIFDFGPEKLPGLSRNGPLQARKMLIMISRLCPVRSKSILVILNSDFGQIVLRKTVTTLCSTSFTSRYKVLITLALQSRVSVIPYKEVDLDWFSEEPRHWIRVIHFRAICFWYQLKYYLFVQLVQKQLL